MERMDSMDSKIVMRGEEFDELRGAGENSFSLAAENVNVFRTGPAFWEVAAAACLGVISQQGP